MFEADISKNDKVLFKAMLASSLFFCKTKNIVKREDLFLKTVMSLVVSGKAKTIQAIVDILIAAAIPVDENQVKSAIMNLKKDRILDCNDNGEISIPKDKKGEIDKFVEESRLEMDVLVDDVVKSVLRVSNNANNYLQQIKTNIKKCIEYYFEVSSLSFFNVDEAKEISELQEIVSLASNNLHSKNDEIAKQIIFALGCLINNPTENQRQILEKIAKLHVSAQLMNQDPLLANFKRTKIRGKKFVLDTDVVLYAITDYASKSKQYRLMIDSLIRCGCELYIPEEIINEVYNHGEASIKCYPFVSQLIGIQEDDVPKNLRNVFIEDFHYAKILKQNTGSMEWSNFIRNYYNEEYGLDFTKDVIKDKLNNNIKYGPLPSNNNYNVSDFENLKTLALEETQKTEKASHRPEDKNEEIASTDSRIYLILKNLNANLNTGGRKGELMNDYYFVTVSYRIQYCAERIGLGANVLCHPQKLIAYLAEAGLVDNNSVSFIKLFDNPFLLYTAHLVQEDVNKLLQTGLNLKGVNAIRMKYDLEKEIQVLLTDTNVVNYEKFYESATSKGYKFDDQISEIMTENGANKERIDNLLQQLADRDQQLSERNDIIEKQTNTINRLNYENRISQEKSHKRKNNKRYAKPKQKR